MEAATKLVLLADAICGRREPRPGEKKLIVEALAIAARSRPHPMTTAGGDDPSYVEIMAVIGWAMIEPGGKFIARAAPWVEKYGREFGLAVGYDATYRRLFMSARRRGHGMTEDAE